MHADDQHAQHHHSLQTPLILQSLLNTAKLHSKQKGQQQGQQKM